MLRSPGERGERGLVTLPKNLKLPAAVGINVETFQKLKWGEGGGGSLVPTPRAPPGEKRSGEQSQISWAYSPKQ